MISKDQSIVTQVAAKIASELTNTTAIPDRSPEAIQALYLSHFDFVVELMNDTHGFTSGGSANTASSPSAMPTMPTTSAPSVEASIQQAFPTATYESHDVVHVKGVQHGPLPAWLVDACVKQGVTSVYDNRDTANAENKRPLFKAADGKVNDKGFPIAFWAPKGR